MRTRSAEWTALEESYRASFRRWTEEMHGLDNEGQASTASRAEAAELEYRKNRDRLAEYLLADQEEEEELCCAAGAAR